MWEIQTDSAFYEDNFNRYSDLFYLSLHRHNVKVKLMHWRFGANKCSLQSPVSLTWHLFWSVKIESSIVSTLISQMLGNKIYVTNLTAFKCSPRTHKGIKTVGCSGYKWLNFFTPASNVLLFMQSILSSNDNNNQMLAASLDWFFQASKQRNTHNFTLSRLFILICYL